MLPRWFSKIPLFGASNKVSQRPRTLAWKMRPAAQPDRYLLTDQIPWQRAALLPMPTVTALAQVDEKDRAMADAHLRRLGRAAVKSAGAPQDLILQSRQRWLKKNRRLSAAFQKIQDPTKARAILLALSGQQFQALRPEDVEAFDALPAACFAHTGHDLSTYREMTSRSTAAALELACKRPREALEALGPANPTEAGPHFERTASRIALIRNAAGTQTDQMAIAALYKAVRAELQYMETARGSGFLTAQQTVTFLELKAAWTARDAGPSPADIGFQALSAESDRLR